MRIDLWTDLVCPWCYLGKRRLEAALAGFEHADQVEVFWHSYQLDPTAPTGVTGLKSVDHLREKFGLDDAKVAEMSEQMLGLAAAEGMSWKYDEANYVNTGDAHRLIQLAGNSDLATQSALVEALSDAHWAQSRNIADHSVLTELAVSVGLDEARVVDVLAGNEFAAEVSADQRNAAAMGSNGVPFFVFDEKYGISGAQPADFFAAALQQVWDETHASA